MDFRIFVCRDGHSLYPTFKKEEENYLILYVFFFSLAGLKSSHLVVPPPLSCLYFLPPLFPPFITLFPPPFFFACGMINLKAMCTSISAYSLFIKCPRISPVPTTKGPNLRDIPRLGAFRYWLIQIGRYT